METAKKNTISVSVKIQASLKKVWKCWTNPNDVMAWNFASDDWFSPRAVNDLRPGGSFNYRMEARDGSMGFDFSGKYTDVIINNLIQYELGDGRQVLISFFEKDGMTIITETFDPEKINPPELQKSGWQSILNNFKKYTESV